MLIEHFGHTCFEVTSSKARAIIDPIAIRSPDRLRDRASPCWADWISGPPAHLFVSHSHDDHLHPPSLLGFSQNQIVHAYGEASCNKLRALGFADVQQLRPGMAVDCGDGLEVIPLAVDRSVDGVEQCAFLFVSGDCVVLDAVDAHDGPVLRQSLETYRDGRIDLAFVPAAASVQWRGYYNQMDLFQAMQFSRWLAPRNLTCCGGMVSMHAHQSLGRLERYPTGPDSFAEVMHRGLAETTRVFVRNRPSRYQFDDEGALVVLASRPIMVRAGSMDQRHVSPTAAVFFCGYRPLEPTIRMTGHVLEASDGKWRRFAATIGALADDLASIARRCDHAENCTPAARIAGHTIAFLRQSQSKSLGAILAWVPCDSTDPDELDIEFFDLADALIKQDCGLDPAERVHARALVALERRLLRLETEHLAMKLSRQLDAERTRDLRARHHHRLIEHLDERSVSLTPNHVIFDPGLLQGSKAQGIDPETKAIFACASPDGVQFLKLSEVELLLLGHLDGRQVGKTISIIAEALEVGEDLVLSGLEKLIVKLTEASIHVFDWT